MWTTDLHLPWHKQTWNTKQHTLNRMRLQREKGRKKESLQEWQKEYKKDGKIEIEKGIKK
jgi:hypothetical protein